MYGTKSYSACFSCHSRSRYWGWQIKKIPNHLVTEYKINTKKSYSYCIYIIYLNNNNNK